MGSSFWKKGISLLLVFILLVSYGGNFVMPVAIAEAAEQYYINFDADDKLATTIIEGNAIGVKANIPPGHMFDGNKPFIIKINGIEADEGLLDIKTNNKNYYTITANKNAAHGTKGTADEDPRKPVQTNYTLEPKLMATLNDGDGLCEQGSGDDRMAIAAKITKKGQAIPITINSSFSFQILKVSGSNTSDDPLIIQNISPIQTATGEFTNLKGKTVTAGNIVKSGNTTTIPITIDNMEFEINMNLPVNTLIQNGATFTFHYRLQDITALILSVVTPQKAVDDVITGVRDNPTNAQVTDESKIPYIRLKDGDTLTSITTNFDVLAQVKKFNADISQKIHIDWSWEPENSNYSDVVVVGQDGRQTRPITLNPRKEDVKGSLVAKADYSLRLNYNVNGESIKRVESAIIKVPITIFGTGDPPKLSPLTQSIGTASGAVNTTPITELPQYMDVYKGGVVDYTAPTKPFSFNANLFFGQGRGRSEKVIITAADSTPDAVALFIDNSPIPYEFGSDIVNEDKIAGEKLIEFQAKKEGQVRLNFDFYVRNSKGQLVKSDRSFSVFIVVDDTTPRSYADLENIVVYSKGLDNPRYASKYPGGKVDFGFKPNIYTYNISMPWNAKSMTLTPTIPAKKGMKPDIEYRVKSDPEIPNPTGILKSGETLTIPEEMAVENQLTITFTTKAEDGTPKMYIIKVTRMPQERDSALKALSVKDLNAKELLTDFSPAKREYSISVPYRTKDVSITAIANSLFAPDLVFTPELGNKPATNRILSVFSADKNWVKLTHPDDTTNGYTGNAVTTITIKVQAEDPNPLYSTTYTIKITRQDPSKNDMLSDLVAKKTDGTVLPLDMGAVFSKDVKGYSLRIPYSVTEFALFATPDDKLATQIQFSINDGTMTTEQTLGDGAPVKYVVKCPRTGGTEQEFKIKVYVTAESGKVTNPPYTITVTRNDPENDPRMQSLTVTNLDNKPVPNFTFNVEKLDYIFNIPYDIEQVKITPKAKSDLSTVYVKYDGKEYEITSNKPYVTVAFKAGQTKEIVVEVKPEDDKGERRRYTLNITRLLPSTDARLKSLTINGGENFSPRFVPNSTNYSVTIPEGTKNITFTAVPVHEASTMSINGVTLESGKASAAYEPVDAVTNVYIDVVAQDGKTTMTYTIKVTNENLIPKSTNADLSSLTINYGSLSPRFKPSITEYDFAVKDEVSSIDIIPQVAQRNASVEVYADSKKLGDYYDNYSTVVRDGTTQLKISVTAQDGKATKDYVVNVYRKDEENAGIFKPITADMVDFVSTNPIVIDITKYPIISADVFNTLKQKYPEKTILFEGNDYSLQIRGKDINGLVPHTNTYDLSLSFTSPHEEAVYNILSEDYRNDDVDPVFIYFNHHGTLPGPMKFTISLGRPYKDTAATWYYYNEERDRIDLYGGLKTNSRGTFTVTLDHMSTYLWSKEYIVGAENKTNSTTNGSGSGKPNPDTGVTGEQVHD